MKAKLSFSMSADMLSKTKRDQENRFTLPSVMEEEGDVDLDSLLSPTNIKKKHRISKTITSDEALSLSLLDHDVANYMDEKGRKEALLKSIEVEDYELRMTTLTKMSEAGETRKSGKSASTMKKSGKRRISLKSNKD